eukprot:scaffold54527_cov24-Attheya_sp.AAC.2
MANKKDARLKPDEYLEDFPRKRRRVMERGNKTGAWLAVLPSIVNGMTLSADKFRDGLAISVGYTLQCKTGGLVIMRHNEVKDELRYLAGITTSSNAVRDEPLSNQGHPATGGVAANANANPQPNDQQATPEGLRGDLLVRGVWSKRTSCIVNVRICDTDSNSYLSSTPEKVLRKKELEKKKKYLQPCLDSRRDFTPCVLLVDGMLATEAKELNKRLAGKIANRWKTTYPKVCGWVNARISIATLRATHLCLRGSRVPIKHICSRWSNWDDGAGLGLFRSY